MRMSAEQRVPASRQAVWEALNDPEVLRRSIPGCESIERIGDNELAALSTATRPAPIGVMAKRAVAAAR